MKTQAMLMGMRYYSPQECEITKVVTLTDQDYNYFRNNLFEKYDFIRNNQHFMGYEGNTPRCLLVMGQHTEDGILVEGDSSGRATRTAHFPEAASYVQIHANELTADLTARRMVTQDDVIIMEARHVLYQYGEDGGVQADFSDCYLSALDFQDCQFNGANFRGAYLEGCDLSGAGMCFCDFTDAIFVRCNAEDLSAEEANFQNATILECDFQDARLMKCNMLGVTVDESDFCGANLKNSTADMDAKQDDEVVQQGSIVTCSSQGNGPDECWDEDHICPSCLAAMGGL